MPAYREITSRNDSVVLIKELVENFNDKLVEKQFFEFLSSHENEFDALRSLGWRIDADTGEFVKLSPSGTSVMAKIEEATVSS